MNLPTVTAIKSSFLQENFCKDQSLLEYHFFHLNDFAWKDLPNYKFVGVNWMVEQTCDLYYHGNTSRAHLHMT